MDLSARALNSTETDGSFRFNYLQIYQFFCLNTSEKINLTTGKCDPISDPINGSSLPIVMISSNVTVSAHYMESKPNILQLWISFNDSVVFKDEVKNSVIIELDGVVVEYEVIMQN